MTRTAQDRRMYVWAHNGLMGGLRMTEIFLFRVMLAQSTSAEAKRIAFDMSCQIASLRLALKTRIDPPCPK